MTGGSRSPTKLNTFSEKQVEAAAKAWLEWQFKERKWEDASSAMRDKFREGVRVILMAAQNAA